MMRNKTAKQDLAVYGGLFLLAFIVVFISCLNPFGSKGVDADTSVYLTIAQGITRGQVPFKDFFDNKGPLTYLISTPGMRIGGLTGVWLTELLFMCVSVFFAFKTALFFGNKRFAFLGVICSFIVFQSFFYEVAGTEEYSLPFMMISFYIFTKYFFTQTESYKEPPAYELIIIGICCAMSVFIRINMFPLWMGFCLVIFFQNIAEKQWICILKYILCFTLGILIVSIPVFLYLKNSNTLSDYINQNFFSGGSRAFTGFSIKDFVKSFLIIMYKNFCFIPLAAGFIWIVKKSEHIRLVYTLAYLLSYLLTIFFLAVIRTNFDHYNMTLTPFLIPGFTFLVRLCFSYFADRKHKNIVVLAFLGLLLAKEISLWFYDGYILINRKDTTRNDLIAAGNMIDRYTEPGDRIISLGFPCQIYLFTERQSASRYIYQTSGAAYDPQMQREFLLDLEKNKPKIIAVRRDEQGRYDYLPGWYAPVYAMIAAEYRLLSDEHGFYLFIRTTPGAPEIRP
jgi:hypothetical protein